MTDLGDDWASALVIFIVHFFLFALNYWGPQIKILASVSSLWMKDLKIEPPPNMQ